MNNNTKTRRLQQIEQGARETRALIAKEKRDYDLHRNEAQITEWEAHLETLAKMRGKLFNTPTVG